MKIWQLMRFVAAQKISSKFYSVFLLSTAINAWMQLLKSNFFFPHQKTLFAVNEFTEIRISWHKIDEYGLSSTPNCCSVRDFSRRSSLRREERNHNLILSCLVWPYWAPAIFIHSLNYTQKIWIFLRAANLNACLLRILCYCMSFCFLFSLESYSSSDSLQFLIKKFI